MRLAILSPTFPPDHCGVGDYTARLTRELAAQRHTLRIWTRQPNPSASHETSSATLETVPGPWNLGHFRRIEKSIAEWKAEGLLIQFTPTLYGPKSRGLSPAFLSWVAGLSRNLACPIGIIVHELHYPVGFSPDRLLVGFPQLMQFELLASLAPGLAFTNELPRNKTASRHLWKARNMIWVPVGATIEPSEAITQRLLSPRPAREHRILLQFGSSHPSRLFTHSFDALEAALRETSGQAELRFAGLSTKDVRRLLREAGRESLLPRARGLGYLEENQVSEELTNADVVLAPFFDGASTRRTSLMAAFAHACPVVTTRGVFTDPSIPWDRICRIVPHDSPSAFAEAALGLLRQPPLAARLGKAGHDFWRERFTWPKIASELVHWLQGLR